MTNKDKNAEEKTEASEAVPSKDSAPEPKVAEVIELDPAEKSRQEALYLRAEFDNYKKRILREQQDSIRFANKNLITEILNVVDLFDRALDHTESLKTKGDDEVKNFVTGIEMTRQELTQLLGRFGVEFIGQVGEKFDPVRHEAISQQEAPEEKVDTVLAVVQKGCLLHGKLIKPARVVVGKKSE